RTPISTLFPYTTLFRSISERLIKVSRDRAEQFDRVRQDGQLTRLRPDLLTDDACVSPLAEQFLALDKPESESPYGFRCMACHERRHRAGIQSAAQENTERDIAHQPQAHGFAEHLLELLDVVLEVPFFRPEFQLPISAQTQASILPLQPMGGWQLADSLENRTRRGHVKVGEKIIQRGVV